MDSTAASGCSCWVYTADTQAAALPPELRGCALLIPVLSVGYCSVHALDTLLQPVNGVDAFSRVGHLIHPAVVPVCGYRTCGSLSTAVEVHLHKSKKVAVLQQRAPVVQGRQEEYAEFLQRFVRDAGFSHTVLVVGVDAGRRTDRYLGNRPQAFLVGSHGRLLDLPSLEHESNYERFFPANSMFLRMLSRFSSQSSGCAVSAVCQFTFNGEHFEALGRLVGQHVGL